MIFGFETELDEAFGSINLPYCAVPSDVSSGKKTINNKQTNMKGVTNKQQRIYRETFI